MHSNVSILSALADVGSLSDLLDALERFKTSVGKRARWEARVALAHLLLPVAEALETGIYQRTANAAQFDTLRAKVLASGASYESLKPWIATIAQVISQLD